MTYYLSIIITFTALLFCLPSFSSTCVDAFLLKNSFSREADRTIIISTDPVKPHLIDDYVATEFNSHGWNNAGLFSYYRNDLQPRILKVMSSSVSKKKFENLVENSLLGEKYGTAKVLSYGQIHGVKKWPYYYIEYAHVFFNSNVISWKHLLYEKNADNNYTIETQKKIFSSMAKLISRLAKDKINPVDIDFLITDKGAVRLIDADWWVKGSNNLDVKKTIDTEITQPIKDLIPLEVFNVYIKNLSPWLRP